MNFLARLGQALAVVLIIVACVLFGAIGSCSLAHKGWEPGAPEIATLGGFVGLVVGVLAVRRLFPRH